MMKIQMTTLKQKSCMCKDFRRIAPSWILGAAHIMWSITLVASGGRTPPVMHGLLVHFPECFVASGLPTVRIWNRANAGCHSWNPLTWLLSLFVPLTEG